MGDVFHSTSANQQATNQQIGISTRDVGGSVTTGAAGSVTSGSGISVGSGANVNVTSLDSTALKAAADTINHAIDVQSVNSTNALSAYQQALTAVGENQQATTAAVTGQAQSALGQLGINPSQIMWIAIAIVGAILVSGFIRSRGK